jgi:hypothetical protein
MPPAGFSLVLNAATAVPDRLVAIAGLKPLTKTAVAVQLVELAGAGRAAASAGRLCVEAARGEPQRAVEAGSPAASPASAAAGPASSNTPKAMRRLPRTLPTSRFRSPPTASLASAGKASRDQRGQGGGDSQDHEGGPSSGGDAGEDSPNDAVADGKRPVAPFYVGRSEGLGGLAHRSLGHLAPPCGRASSSTRPRRGSQSVADDGAPEPRGEGQRSRAPGHGWRNRGRARGPRQAAPRSGCQSLMTSRPFCAAPLGRSRPRTGQSRWSRYRSKLRAWFPASNASAGPISIWTTSLPWPWSLGDRIALRKSKRG